jgi:hypothetical protein
MQTINEAKISIEDIEDVVNNYSKVKYDPSLLIDINLFNDIKSANNVYNIVITKIVTFTTNN